MLEATDYGGSQVTTAVRKRERSGERFAHQLSGDGCTRKLALVVYSVCGCSFDFEPRGGFLGQGDRPLP